MSGQTTSRTADEETIKLISSADDSRGQETGALIILKDYRFTIDEKGNTNLELRILGKLYSRKAVSDYAQIPLGFNSYYENARLDYARVILNDGTVMDVPPDAVQLKTSPEISGLQYTDMKYLSFALSGLEPGASFDYHATFTQIKPVIEGEWFDNHLFSGLHRSLDPGNIPRIDPVMTSRLTLVVPEGEKFLYSLQTDTVKSVFGSVGNQDKYVWELKNLPAVYIEEGSPSINKLCPVIELTSLTEWSQVDAWANEKFMSRVEATGKVREKAMELTRGVTSETEKIRLISSFIQSSIHYIYTDLDRGGFTPHYANEILQSKYGDCKDQTILLISMLRAVGINALPVILNPRPYDEMSDIPTPLINHMIAFIRGREKDFWLDMTSGVTPFPGIFFPNQGRRAFVINGTGGMLLRVPESSNEANKTDFSLETANSNGSLSVKMSLEAAGTHSDIVKMLMKRSEDEDQKQAIENLILAYFDKAHVDSVTLSDVHDPDKNLEIRMQYHADSVTTKGREAAIYGSHALLPLSFLGGIETVQLMARRHNDFIIEYGSSIRGTERYNPPQNGFLPVILPDPDSIRNEFFSFSQNFKYDGNSVIVRWKFNTDRQVIRSDRFDDYRSSLKNIKSMLGWQLIYVDPGAYIGRYISSENPFTILKDCRSTLSIDHDNMLALLIQGTTYGLLMMNDSADISFTRALKIDQRNKYANHGKALALMATGNKSKALGYLDKAILADPEFTQAFITRGNYYMSTGFPDKALSDFVSALRSDPDNVAALQGKGYLIGRQGQSDEAFRLLRKAAMVDSTNFMTFSIMAELSLDLDRFSESIELYLKSIKLNPKYPLNYGNLGWAYYMSGDFEKCIVYSKKATSLNPNAFFAEYNIALATLRLGKTAEARKLYDILKLQAFIIPEDDRKGAKDDLVKLRSEGKFVKEVTAILNDYF